MSNRSRYQGKVAPDPKRTVHNLPSIPQTSSREPFPNSIVELNLISYCNCNFVSSYPRKLGTDLHIPRDKNQQEKEDKNLKSFSNIKVFRHGSTFHSKLIAEWNGVVKLPFGELELFHSVKFAVAS